MAVRPGPGYQVELIKVSRRATMLFIVSPIKGRQSDAVDDICCDVVEDEGHRPRLQGEVGHQGAVDADFHLEAGDVLQPGPGPGDEGRARVDKFEGNI